MAATSKNVRLCSRCKAAKSKVHDSRDESGMMRRLRICPNCGMKWTTVEVFEWEYDRLCDIAKKAEKCAKTGKPP